MRRFGKLVLARKERLRTNGVRARLMHVSMPALQNKPVESASKAPEEDQFADMMDDRTNALLQSLGMNLKKFKEKELERQNQSPKKKVAAPLVAAVNVDINKGQTPLTPPTHFFDTQDVYTELRSAGLTPGQAEVIMRTMQELIQELVKTCKDRSVPVSAAANEAYLFDAASSEVRNEISNSRQAQSTTYRAGLARLQRDVEILEHEATEMTSLLKSDLDIEVHERKNSTRAEENVIQLKIQDLNNKISTRLNSELKSEIENLRWQITRRSLAAIAVIAASFIWLTQTSNRTKTAKTQERQRQSAGAPVPVPVLAPSMASSEEPYDNSAVSVPVEDLAGFSNNNGIPAPESAPPRDDTSTDASKSAIGEDDNNSDFNSAGSQRAPPDGSPDSPHQQQEQQETE